ncbi:MAG TPA: hypothetical protein VGF64_11425 [Acidimicrobiales bacterium]|jgi:hypothetical protein
MTRDIATVAQALVVLALAAGCAASAPSSGLTSTTVAPITTTTEPSATATTAAPAPAAAAPTGAVPNPALTPGEALPGVTAAQVCQAGWASAHRDVPEAERVAVFAAYGVPYAQRGGYELDHLISLELGGDNARANLWPEPHDRPGFPGSQTKDGAENRLHDLVCAGRLDLAAAQRAIATNWQTTLAGSGPSP